MAYDLAAPKPEDEIAEDGHDAVCKLSDEEFIAYVRDERSRSVGFHQGDELQSDRVRSMDYYKGDLTADMPASEGRSAAVSMDTLETIETILPDLIDIFVSEDVAAFDALTKQDEKQAKTETDYVHSVLFDQNSGFVILYTMFKDALLNKTGMVTWWWEAIPEDDKEAAEPEPRVVSPMEAAAAVQEALSQGQEPPQVSQEAGPDGLPIFKLAVAATEQAPAGKLCIKAFPPEDFTIAADGVTIAETPYCARRSRPRIQDLIALGLDEDKVRNLPPYGSTRNNGEDQARDTAGESNHNSGGGGIDDLRQVEVVYHYLRVDADEDGQPELWEILTGGDETILLDKQRVGSVNIAAITPYLTPHRFYGQSVADHVAEIQRIKTTLTRGFLDSIYFGLNQRHEINVSAGHANEFTLSDLMNNQPGWPVRSKSGEAVRALSNGGPAADFPGALEYFSTVSENRTGIVRNAQGINPSTLHDTATGALALMSNAQRRVRLIARIFGETGLKDLFIGIHAMLRQNAKRAVEQVKLRSGWAENLTPSTWPERSSLKVKIGLGAAGRDHDLAFMERLIGLQKTVVEMQGGTHGPFVTDQNVSNTLHKFATLGGQDADEFFSEPPPADPNNPPQPPQPAADPKAEAAMAKAQTDAGRLQLDTQQAQADAADKAAARALAQDAQSFNQRLAIAKLQQERELAIATIEAQFKTTINAATIRAQAEELRVGADLTIKAAGQNHDLTMAAHEAAHAADAVAHQAAQGHIAALRDHVLGQYGAEAQAARDQAAAPPDSGEPAE